MPEGLDGITFLPTLEGRPEDQVPHEFLYWEFHERGGRTAVREGRWKGVRYDVQGDPAGRLELYDLDQDIGETTDRAADFPEVAARLDSVMRASHTDSDVFPFSLP